MRIAARGFSRKDAAAQSENVLALQERRTSHFQPVPSDGIVTAMSVIVGIDLGTTNSLIGVMEAGFPILIADEGGARLTPSVVHFPTEGMPLVGHPAMRMRNLDPENTVYSVKRFIGRRMGEEADDVAYKVVGGSGEPVSVRVRGRDYLPEEVSAEVLRKLRADAGRALGEPVTRAVITVPAYFNDAQRNATKRAGELAGLTVERIVNEPTAAALAYGLDRLRERSKVAVFDLGGGTFDISILELSQGVFHVLSTNGNTRLGGDDIDAALVANLADRVSPGSALDAAFAARLREAAVEVKHQLSTVEEALVELPFAGGGRSVSVKLTRVELERVAQPIVGRTRAICLRALADAKLKPEELDEIILVGGQTRMPLVRRLVAEIFGREPDISQNPDEAVALGAVIQAGILSGAVQNVVLLDVTPLSLGIETFGGLMSVIIPRNSTIPLKRGEMFTNAVSGQRSMLLRVLQGERELAKDNWELGRFELEFEQAPKGQARVGVQFEIDANGILKVLARDTKTGREKVLEVSSAVDVSDEAVEKMLEESLEHAFEDMNDRAFTEAKLKAGEMLPAVRIALEQVGSQLGEEERRMIAARVAEVEAAIQAGGAPTLKKAVVRLDDATQHLAALLVEKAIAQAGPTV
jgi:molecular chaperone DnaK